MIARLRELLVRLRPASPEMRRTALVSTAVTAAVTVVLWLGRETLFELAGDVAKALLVDGPLWLRIAVGGLLLAGFATAAIAVVAARRRPRPDNPPAEPAGGATLPSVASTVIGRDDDQARVVPLLDNERMVAIVGQRAAGTSTLALVVAHEVAHRFPDGQVYLDLRNTAGHPLSGALALRHVLRRLGLAEPRSNRPYDVDDGAQRFRSWCVGRRVLFVLDNVDRPEQVRRLVAAGGQCGFLLAGTAALAKVPGVRAYPMQELNEDDAVALLAAGGNLALGDETRKVAVDLVTRYGRQPLAIKLLGQLLQDRQWSMTRIVETVESDLLVPRSPGLGLSPALRPVWTASDVTYRDLNPSQRRMFRRLALVSTVELGIQASAAVAGVSPNRAAGLMAELTNRGLVESVRPDRFRIRQEFSTLARFYLNHEESDRQRDRAVARLARHCTLIAETYTEAVFPTERWAGEEKERDRVRKEARRWFESEHELLLSLITSRGTEARTDTGDDALSLRVQRWLWRLAVGLCSWYAVAGRLSEWAQVCRAVLELPIVQVNPAAALWAHNQLGVVHRLNGEPRAAWGELQLAAELSHHLRRRGLAQVHTNLGLTLIDQGQLDSAARHLESSLEMRPRTDHHGRAVSALGLGVAYLRIGELDVAREQLGRAADEFDSLGDQHGLAATLNALGVLLWEQDDYLGATEHWDLARSGYRSLRDDAGTASVLLNIAAGLLARQPERVDEACELLTECIRLRADCPSTRLVGLAHMHLGDALARREKMDDAKAHWTEATRILVPLGGPAAAEASRRPTDALVE